MIGQRRPLLSNWRVPLPVGGDVGTGNRSTTLRAVVAAVVRREVAAFRERREERRLMRIFSPVAIQEAAATGKVAPGGPSDAGAADAELDVDGAVVTALQAFQDGLYFVFVDDRQQHDLDAPLLLSPGSRLNFIRLVALAGG